MGKFWILFKKEAQALLNVQTLAPLVLIFVMFYFMGDIMGGLLKEESIVISDANGGEADVTVSISDVVGFIDNDNSEYSNTIKNVLSAENRIALPASSNPEEALKELETYNFHGEEIKVSSLVIINAGFEENLKAGNSTAVDVYTSVDSFGLTSMLNSGGQSAAAMINAVISQELLTESEITADISFLTNPVHTTDYTYLNETSANVNASAIQSYVSSQLTFVPVIIMVIILMAASTLATSMVNEKADKTLETLMTTPVSRMSVLMSKLFSAGVYAAIYAIVYIFAFRNFNQGMMGGSTFSEEFMKIIEDFGIVFDATTFIVIGIQLFLSVLCGLAIALIIGMMVDDVKALQSYIMPLMIIIMIPYFLSMFLDINTLPMIGKILIYAIPFTHSFTAASNLFMQNYSLLIFGIVYQFIFVAGILTLAVRIFNSDKLFTLGQMFARKPGANKKGGLKLFNK